MYHIKNDKRAQLSSKLIYNALIKIMETKTFHTIKITEIVREAQIGRATFYRNFDSTIDVLTYTSDKTFEGLLEYLITYYKRNPITHSSEFLVPFLTYFDENSLIVSQLIKAKRQDILSDSLIKIFEKLKAQFNRSAEKPNITWDYFLAIRTGITINILVQWVKSEKNIPPNKLGLLISNQLKNSFTVDQFI